MLQSVIRVIHTPNAKLPFMFRCYVWYFCYGLILTIYHESIWSQILFLWKPRLLTTFISQRVACARVVTHTHCQSNLSLPMQFTCCGLTPCITFTDFIVQKSFYCKSAREKIFIGDIIPLRVLYGSYWNMSYISGILMVNIID